MVEKIVTALLVGSSLVLAGCATVKGAAKDVTSVANCAENAINNGVCR